MAVIWIDFMAGRLLAFRERPEPCCDTKVVCEPLAGNSDPGEL